MAPIVETAQGRLRGSVEPGVCVFKGVPFALPPLGSRRFAPPSPVEAWNGVRDASRFGPSAPQNPIEFDLMPGLGVGATDEDCLYLNVFTPACDSAARPVMVWIHGGAFTIGSGSQSMYDPRPLVSRGDVVVVTINYRLGALGFLSLGDHTTSANAGLLDQVAALHWVRQNIAAFGGEPSNVTIFGESAGGMSVGCLLGLPAARGLFRRAIAMSGAAHSVSDAASAAQVRAEFCDELGVADSDVAALRNATAAEILAAQSRCEARHASEVLRMGFRPSVDGPGGALPEPPIEAVRAGLSRDVDVMVGCTRDEWRLFGLMDAQAATLDAAALLARVEERAPDHAARIVAAYREARPEASPGDLFFAIESDRFFRVPAIRLADAQCAHRRETWAYLFAWESPQLGGQLGACHGIDVPFVFGLIGTEGGSRFAGGGPAAEALAESTMDAWLAFARSGDPNHGKLPGWERFDVGRRPTMVLGADCELVFDPYGSERAAWDGVIG